MDKDVIEKELLSDNQNVFTSPINNTLFDFREARETHFYFIVTKTKDEKKIVHLAKDLLSKGCRDFHFCGLHEPLWHLEFDSVYVELFQDEDGEKVALTSGYETLEDFAEELFINMYYWYANEDHYLIYDDEEEYKKLLTFWKEEKWKC